MKKILIAALAAATALTGMASTASAQGYYRDGYSRDVYSRDVYSRDSDRDGRPDAREWNRDRDRDGRPDQYDRYDNRRDGRQGQRQRQHRHYGSQYGYEGYQGRWREGARYTHYRDRAYYIDDYRTYGLQAPRPGYRYYRDDNGDVLMVAIASGLIGAIIGGALNDNDRDHNYRGNYRR